MFTPDISMQDTFKHKGQRKKLIEEIRKCGFEDEQILKIIDDIPRHFFLDKAFEKFAYQNTAFKIGAGQTISQPLTVAIQTQLLQVKKGEKVLEIGTGSAYQAIVLCKLGAKVFTIERQRELYLKAKKMLLQFNCTAKTKYGDGYKGWPAFSPFDKIIVTCGAPDVPQELVAQLKNGGKMVIPVGEGSSQKMILLEKEDNGVIKTTEKGTFSFVPMLENTEK